MTVLYFLVNTFGLGAFKSIQDLIFFLYIVTFNTSICIYNYKYICLFIYLRIIIILTNVIAFGAYKVSNIQLKYTIIVMYFFNATSQLKQA
jgi:hypothetical protein